MFSEIINTLSNWLYTYILIVLLLGAGIYFTVKTKFIQFRCLKEAIRVVKEPSDDKESILFLEVLQVLPLCRELREVFSPMRPV